MKLSPFGGFFVKARNMKQRIVLRNLKPLSVNSSYARTQRGVAMSDQASKWRAEAFYQMEQEENARALRLLRTHFDPKKHSFRVELTALYPRADFVTKAGTLSARMMDISNFEKALIDVLFLEKFHGKSCPVGADNICTDDKYILECVSRKRVSEDNTYALIVDVEILDFSIEDYICEVVSLAVNG